MISYFLHSTIYSQGLEDISIVYETITGGTLGLYLRTCWKIVRPIGTIMIFVDECINRNIQSYHITAFDSGLDAPPELEYFGAACDLVYLLFVLSYVIYELSKVMKYKAKSCRQRTMFLISPEYDRARILDDPDSAKRGYMKHWLYFSDPMGPSVKEQLKLSFMSITEAIKKIMSKLKPKANRAPLGRNKNRLSKSRSGTTIQSENDESAWEILAKAKHLHRPSLVMEPPETTEQAGPSRSPKSNPVQGKKRLGKENSKGNIRKSVIKKPNSGAKPYV
ncbi:unnamed protein product [Orchesella dallaii]|uniref:Uncharacterized protein n=1 Tax=Orchesella dallaii TaxID=48710 RepID=A0ABP1PKA2_9HEXA